MSRFIRASREAAGLTQGQVAFALGVSRQHVNQWELDNRTVPPDHFARLADALGVPLDRMVELSSGLCAPRTSILACPRRPLDPLECSVEDMVKLGYVPSRLYQIVLERLGVAQYEDLRHALLRDTPTDQSTSTERYRTRSAPRSFPSPSFAMTTPPRSAVTSHQS